MMTRLLMGLFMLAMATSVAGAASFDCKKASTPFETAICADPELSKTDDLLAVAYQTAIGGLSKAALAEMQASQRDWLDFAQRSCTDDAQLPKVPYSEDQIACLRSSVESRVRRLEQSRMWSGLRLYALQNYSVIPDTTAEPDAWSKVAMREVSVPRIDGKDGEAAAFAEFVEQYGPKLEDGQDETSDVQIFAEVDGITPQRISLIINNWWYGHGAAHGNYDITYAHYLREPQRALEASDIFDKDGWEEQLGRLALAELDETIEGGIWEESRGDAAAYASQPSRWNFKFEGLVVQYQPYEVTAYAYGAPTVTIPWAQLTDYLAADALTIGQY